MAVCGLCSHGKTIILTGSEDTFLKASVFDGKELIPLVTFSNHVASIRSIAKIKLDGENYLVMSAGSRMQAHLYIATLPEFSMSHFCHYLKNYEHDQEQDFRIMASVLLKSESGDILALLGSSNGQVQGYKVSFQKRRLEESKGHFSQFKSSVLSMKRCSPQTVAIGLSSGDIETFKVT